MLKIFLLAELSLTLLSSALTSLVNPFVGTDFHGHTFPGAAYPFGMVQLSPDTRPDPGNWDGCSGYHYSDSLIYGFSHTHLSGTGCDDLCDIMFMPVKGFSRPGDRKDYASPFCHDKEKAAPGYYEVYLDRPEVLARLTVGRRTGIHEYTFKGGAMPQIAVDLAHRDYTIDCKIEKVSSTAIQGYRRSRSWATDQWIFFYAEFSAPIIDTQSTDDAMLLSFAASKVSKAITVKVGISSVSEANAKANLMAENNSFAKQLKTTDKEWNKFLTKLSCPSSDLETRKVFYTALYHCAIHPSLYSDVNGEYRGMDHKVHTAVTTGGKPFEQYTIFSLWDTFRGLHPLLCEIEPERTSDFINSFISIYKEAGKLPIWELWGNETNCMIGYNSAPVIADALYRGIKGFNVEEAFEALLVSSKNPGFGMDSFRKNGLVLADDEHESVSKTLEYAYDDWCVAQVAKYLGRDKEYNEYMTSAQYWRNVFDPETGFMRARLNGRWLTPFNPTEVNNHYTEANSWQYSFFVPQDITGLMEALGGKQALLDKIEALFTAPEQTTGRTQADITGQIGQYAHGNEPSHHIAWIPEVLAEREKTKSYVNKILTTLYSSAPDGICGNDDCGQMSAWYVLSMLDRYPICPGTSLKTLTSMPKTIIPNPVFKMENDIFTDYMDVTVENIEEGAKAYVSIDDSPFSEYNGAIRVTKPCTLKAYVIAADGLKSFTTRTSLHQISRDMKLSLFQRYNRQYNAGGDDGLIDGFRGSINWRTGGWQGYQGTDFTAVVDLLEIKHIKEVKAGFCQDARSWIWMPRTVDFYTSVDGESYTLAGHIDNTVDPEDYEIQIHDLGVDIDSDIRYIKVHATQLGTIPDWHPGAGGESFIFIDEIYVTE